jgi:hypothetical protein
MGSQTTEEQEKALSRRDSFIEDDETPLHRAGKELENTICELDFFVF